MHKTQTVAPLRLDIGAGDCRIPGWTPLDIATGTDGASLSYDDGVADEIHAGHVLEHWPRDAAAAVIAEWVRVIKPGGQLSISVPDFDAIVEMYRSRDCRETPIEPWIMGAHKDEHDQHRAIYNAAKLRLLMAKAGLRSIGPWTPHPASTAASCPSVCLRGRKPRPIVPRRDVRAVMSMPRLAFEANMFCAIEAAMALQIPFSRTTGAYWGQCLERAIGEALDAGCGYVLTCDYDTTFDAQDVLDLLAIMDERPDIDALAPLQSHRSRDFAMCTIRGEDGASVDHVPASLFESNETIEVATAHFGLTLLRAAAFEDLPHPWFHGQPASDGTWGEGRVDDDIAFWHHWRQHGNTLHLACHVPIGHLELCVLYPGQGLKRRFVTVNDYNRRGLPADAWR